MLEKISSTITDKALSYTSRGNKFVYHPQQINNFLEQNGKSIISAHIAPTNNCNLKCHYCNQSNRKKGAFLSLDTIKNFVNALKERGLKATIITGGGEPTMYPEFNNLIKWLQEKKLNLALITNGTNDRCGKETVNTWDAFSWIRVSLNFFNNRLRPIKIPHSTNGKIGFSMVYINQDLDSLKQIADVAESYDARYVRILPDCCTSQEEITNNQNIIKEMLDKLGNKRFFVQDKLPSPAVLKDCHQSRLRPFLLPDGKVAPCDCYMLNKDKNGEFYKTLPDKFNLAPDTKNPASYIEYLDRKYEPMYNPLQDCNGCGFVGNNQILEDLIQMKHKYPNKFAEELFSELGYYQEKGIKDTDFV